MGGTDAFKSLPGGLASSDARFLWPNRSDGRLSSCILFFIILFAFFTIFWCSFFSLCKGLILCLYIFLTFLGYFFYYIAVFFIDIFFISIFLLFVPQTLALPFSLSFSLISSYFSSHSRSRDYLFPQLDLATVRSHNFIATPELSHLHNLF